MFPRVFILFITSRVPLFDNSSPFGVHMRRPIQPRILCFFSVIALLASLPLARSASAQVFGKNKVQYEPLDWSVLETPHVRFHYYAEEESLARHLAVYAESVCVEFDQTFRLAKRPPVNFLLYSVHH